MATAPATTAAWLPATVIAQRMRNAAWAFLWGGGMCLVLALWLGTEFDDLPRMIPWFTGLLGLAGISAAALQFWLAWKNQTDQWLAKRPLLGWMALAGGVALIILAVLLVAWYGHGAIGESIGAAVFGVVAMLQGSILVNPLTPDNTNPYLDTLFRNWMVYRNALIGLGVILLVLFLALLKFLPVDMGWFPEIAATLLLALVALIGALWLSTSHSRLTPALLRMLILIQGGVAGLIITLATAVQVYVWRKDIFLDGLSGWQGSNGWQVWVCGYAGIFGLTLMFVSLLLARADIRNQPTLRRALFGYNALVTSLLVVLALALVNIVCYAMFPFTFNWTQGRGLHTLATSTKNLLNNIKVPTTIYVTLSERSPAWTDMRQLLNNCQAQTNQLKVRYISPDKDVDEFRVLKANFPQYFQGKLGRSLEEMGVAEDSGRGILIVRGEHVLNPIMRAAKQEEVKVPTSFIAERKLHEFRRPSDENRRGKEIFTGEVELAKELAFLDENKQKRKLYFLQGHGELDINGRAVGDRPVGQPMEQFGANVLVDKLKKENYDVVGLSFAKELPKGEPRAHTVLLAREAGPDKKKQIPEDCDTLVIAGLSTPAPQETLEALERFLDRGGKLLVCLQSLTDGKSLNLVNPGLDVLLKKYGVKSANEMALRARLFVGDVPIRVYATPAETKNVFTKQFLLYQVPLYTPIVIQPDPTSRKFKAEPLFVLDPRKKILKLKGNPQRLLVVNKFDETDAIGFASEPLPVVVGITEEIDKGDPRPRMVIFGDSEFVSNSQMIDSIQDPAGKPYYDLFASALDWMAERPSVGVRPKESNFFVMKNDVEYGRMYWWPFWLMLLSIAGLGGGMWIVRRR